ncbi:MAG: toxin-antitoxin system YwqK family antitoxin [Flavobacteriales bacterium]|nr:toxin-antitoxin system YwqK family antitoxin [Flavobacteriales bacterium]MBL0034395.1 toxin-antitoxin system YwqK family antitoxin [Flavobacteriales bacterium]
MLARAFFLPLALTLATAAFAQPPAPNQKDAKGLKQGHWAKTWAESSQLRYEGQFKDDKPVGRFTYYSNKGKVESLVDHYPDGKASHAKHYHPNGKLMAEGRYVGQEKDSTWSFFDAEGHKRSMEQWSVGQKDGEQITYYADGKVAEKATWVKGVQQGPFEQFFDNGQPKARSTYQKGQPEGTMTYFFPSGKKEIEGKMVNGDRDGTWYYFNEDGTVQIQILYKTGTYVKDRKENGTFKEYYDQDKLKSEVTYKAGRKEGRFTEWNNDGAWVERPVKIGPDGMQKGDTERVLEGQTKKREGTYKNDLLEGELKEYDENGKLIRTVNYVAGEEVK